MLDFLMISTRNTKRGTVEIYPKFIIKKSKDLMIRGGDFYAIWNEEKQLWCTDEQDAIELIDKELRLYSEEHTFDGCFVKVLYLWDAETGMIDVWHKYCQKQLRDSFHMLDEEIIFSNDVVNKTDYVSKRLNYPLEKGDISSWDKLIGTLYTTEERHKIEWAIGSIVSGDSKKIQKFMVLYGSAGTGKSTILNIIQQLFEGYYTVFDAKALGSSSNSFALEAFKSNPLVAIQHDGDLSRIEDNTRLNSLVSHELMTVNEKFKSTYSNRFKCFLFMGTNKPVKITDAKSGLIRRLIDVTPSGNKLPVNEYNKIYKNISFELGAIAYHCKDVYLSNPNAYDDYIPISMLDASNDFYNFVQDSYFTFKKEDSTTLKIAWEMYKNYCEDSKVLFPLSKRVFKEELKNYFYEYNERYRDSNGERIRNYYKGFLSDKFENSKTEINNNIIEENEFINFNSTESIFDKEYSYCLAQYASDKETPSNKWSNVSTMLSDIDTSKLHYVIPPNNLIVIDFDIPDENGNKCFEINLREASKWPPTYAELSKSGNGIHLHYIYTGDVTKLSRIYEEHIEIKVFTGASSLRRKLTKCNNLPIATISSGLPLKGEKMVNFDSIKNEKVLRSLIIRNLNKEIHPGTKPSIDFIKFLLDNAYDQGLHYDVTDMRNAILTFAANSTNQSEYCLKLVGEMKFKSEEPSENIETNKPIVFYDIEVFPNLFLINWKIQGKDKKIVRMINPKPSEIEPLLEYRLIGFNCRKYDNHIIYAAMLGYDNQQLYELSQRIISGSPNCFFSEAYNLSYTDILDFASAGNKKSLKKLEIEMGIHHKELGLPWDKPVPTDKWMQVAEYCDNDVLATEAAFEYLSADWTARQILADLAGMSVNDSTNTLTQRFIFGDNKNPQNEFNYRNLAEPVLEIDEDTYEFLSEACPEMMMQTHGEAGSALPYFPGYKFDHGKSTYRGESVSEGGYVYAEQGYYENVALLDITSMHPHSVIAEVLFGIRYTRRFRDVVRSRVFIKHEKWEKLNEILDGQLIKHAQKVIDGEMTSKDLANGLKTPINAVYGLTDAGFENRFRDPRNIDNIVAKRGALFMVDLKHAVQEKGFQVAHIKTDSIKIPNATPEIIEFVMDFGKRYGYYFEHEATYEKLCLVNDAVYIAKYATKEKCEKLYGYAPGDNEKHGGEWTATGAQFQVPYVFKSLFSKEEILFDDLCETKSVTTSIYLDRNENLPDVSIYEKELAKELKKEPINETKINELKKEINKGHNYIFIGKVGRFCPIKPGYGGGLLTREKDGKYYAVGGSKGYRWLESEMVYELNLEEAIDKTYYEELCRKAIEEIEKYVNFDDFVRNELILENRTQVHHSNPIDAKKCIF